MWRFRLRLPSTATCCVLSAAALDQALSAYLVWSLLAETSPHCRYLMRFATSAAAALSFHDRGKSITGRILLLVPSASAQPVAKLVSCEVLRFQLSRSIRIWNPYPVVPTSSAMPSWNHMVEGRFVFIHPLPADPAPVVLPPSHLQRSVAVLSLSACRMVVANFSSVPVHLYVHRRTLRIFLDHCSATTNSPISNPTHVPANLTAKSN